MDDPRPDPDELISIVSDFGRLLDERSRALTEIGKLGSRAAENLWREVMREPLRAKLVELGMHASTFDEDFEDVVPLVTLDVNALVVWTMRSYRLRFVCDPKGVNACTSKECAAQIMRVTGVTPQLTIAGPDRVQVTLGPITQMIFAPDFGAGLFDVLRQWATTTGQKVTRVVGRGTWIPTDTQRQAAESAGLELTEQVYVAHVPPEPPRDWLGEVQAIVGERACSLDRDDDRDDRDDDAWDDYGAQRSDLVEIACELRVRVRFVKLEGPRLTIEIDDRPKLVKLPRVRDPAGAGRDKLLRALEAVLAPIGMRFVVTSSNILVLATEDELARLAVADLL